MATHGYRVHRKNANIYFVLSNPIFKKRFQLIEVLAETVSARSGSTHPVVNFRQILYGLTNT